MPLEAVTFDFHDTLASCDAWFQIEVHDLVPRFLAWRSGPASTCTAPDYQRHAADCYRALRQEIIHHGVEQDAAACVLYVLGQLEMPVERDQVEAGIREIMWEALADVSPIPGVIEAVRQLRENGIRLGVISSAVYHPFLEWSLEEFGILDNFDVVVTSASAGYYKSRPEIYTHTLQRLGVAPESAVHVGDSYRFDVEGARRAGMQTVWYARGEREGSGDAADLRVETLVGLAPLLLERFRGD